MVLQKKKLNLGIDSSTILDTYRHILEPNDIDIEFLYGGRDSGKSHFTAQKLIIDCLQLPYFRCIMIKKTHESIKDSQWQTIKDIVEDWGIGHLFKFKTAPLEIICIVNNNKFISRGCDNPTKLKSIRNPSHAWYEEGDQISLEDFTTITTTLRTSIGKVKQYFLFNPELPKGVTDKKDFWLYKNYFSHTNDKNFTKEIEFDIKGKIYKTKYRATHSTYLDNLTNVTADRIAMYENLKITNPSKYLPYCLGEWGQYSNEVPFFYGYNKMKHFAHTNYEPKVEYYIDIGFDFNITPCVCVIGQFDRENQIYHIFDTIMQDHTNIYNLSSLQAVCRKIKEKYLDSGYYLRSRIRITGDASGRSGSADRQVKQNYYYTIQKELQLLPQQFYVRGANLPHTVSGEIINEVFVNMRNNALILHNQDLLERDIETSFPDAKQSLNEAKAKFGLHVLDAWRYLMDFWFNFDKSNRTFVSKNHKKFTELIIKNVNNFNHYG